MIRLILRCEILAVTILIVVTYPTTLIDVYCELPAPFKQNEYVGHLSS